MKLKFKPINLEAGRPIAFLNYAFAEKFNISEVSRIEVVSNGKKLIIPVNHIKKFLREDEISFSDEAISYLGLKPGNYVKISLALEPNSIRFIFKKLNNKELTKYEIRSIINDVVNNALNEAEIAYFISGVYHNSMTEKETIYLTEAIAKTGKTIKWSEKIKNKIADKHSVGGIPGNRTTPIVVSICASAGIIMPKTSSRAITSPAGTADVVETLADVSLSTQELVNVVKKTNACFVWGGALGLAPADDKMIRVERLLNVDPEPQLIASILAKKISVGSKYVLIDIPYGNGAKFSFEKAKKLKKKFIRIGKNFGLKIKVVLTNGEQPIGNGIGPVLEMLDILRVLKRENSPLDLEKKSIFIASKILEMMGKCKEGQGKNFAQEILNSKQALKKFNEIIKAQGKNNSKLELGKYEYVIRSNSSGKIKLVDNKSISLLARILGCPTNISSGIYMHKHKNEHVIKGEPILTLYSESEKKLEEGIRFYYNAKPIKI
ncbi:thymidine phosphorylase [Candidatus Pacearchaeota archaeon]|nr:thymidine phosphorylase [Candidatus Pacearchaeota archaeon]